MLVLSRKLNEKILLPTLKTSIQVVGFKPGLVRLGISAPANVPVLREEVQNRRREWASDMVSEVSPAVARQTELVRNRLDISVRGLELLHRQLGEGLLQDAQATWAEVHDDLLALRARLEGEKATRTGNASCSPRKALLVEDDRNERELLASFLRMAGIEVDTACDGADALEYLHAHAQPDVVLLDMGLPRCDGLTAVKKIRRNPALKNLRIFAVSGHLPGEYNLGTGPKGIDRWFHKPLDSMALLRELKLEWQQSPV
jgi:carbon storage regulator CsrA